ncbi:MAG: phosphatidate cytidylyltransferase [Candidatus Aminicenantales bacterium]
MSLRKRFPTALILLALLFSVIQWTSPLVFFLLLQAFILVALVEFYNIARKKKLYPRLEVGVPTAILISVSFFFKEISLEMALFGGLLWAGIYFFINLNTIEKVVHYPSSLSITIFGVIYLSFTMNFLYPLRTEYGPFYIYFLFAVIFLGDSGAYFLGKLFGRHKMAPMASPKKTWEGSFGGILFAVLGALAAQQVWLKEISLLQASLCGAFVHAVAQISDPIESLFKRAVGIKDSSNILPGHGGFLDRIDSFIFAAPFFYYFIKIFWK